jgi:hypothetical protein
MEEGKGEGESGKNIVLRSSFICEAFFVHKFRAMKTGNKLTYPILKLGACLLVGAACHSAPTTRPRPVQDDPGEIRASREEELTLIAADSEVFAAVVRSQLDGKDDDYPSNLTRFRYDSRPYGTPTGYPEMFAGVQGIDPTLTFAHASQDAIDDVVNNRKRILETASVKEGGPLVLSQCAGARVPAPPPVRGSPTRIRRADVHAGCPKSPQYYLTVGLPIRGQPEGLKNMRDTRGRRVNLGGDVWSVLVTEFAAGPGGWTRSEYAWLFRRNRNRRLELATTVLVGVIE